MRLIDADEFKKQIAGMTILNGYPPEKANVLCEIIDAQPTAYDLDDVITQLSRCYGIVNSPNIHYAEGLKDAYDRAIGIVKVGGARADIS